MAIFFVASGFCFSQNNVRDFDSLLKYWIKLVKRLWLPYVVYNTVLLPFHNTLVQHSLIPGEIKQFGEFVK